MSLGEVRRVALGAQAPAGWRAASARVTLLGALGGVIVAVLTYLMLPPLVVLVQSSFITTNIRGEILEYTLRYYQRVLLNGALLLPLANTLVFALSSCALAL